MDKVIPKVFKKVSYDSRESLMHGGPTLPRTGLIFYAKAPGMVDTIGLSASDYDFVDPAYRSIFFTVTGGVVALVDSTTAYTDALASELLNKGTMLGNAEDGIAALYRHDTPESTLNRAYRYVSKPKTFYHVDSVNGSDSNDGLSLATAFATFSKLSTVLSSGININLVRGSHWRETLDALAVAGPIAIRSVGTGAPPQIDCSDPVPAANWAPHATLPDVYQVSWVTTMPNTYRVLAFEGEEMLIDVTSTSALNDENHVSATPGTFFYNTSTKILYIHTTGSSDPRVNGLTYAASMRYFAIRTHNNSLLSGVHSRRNGHNDGSTVLLNGSDIIDSIFDQGHKHNFLAAGGRNFRNSFFVNQRQDAAASAAGILTFYGNNLSSQDVVIDSCGFNVNTSGLPVLRSGGLGVHLIGNDELRSCLIDKTFFMGFLNPLSMYTKSLKIHNSYFGNNGQAPKLADGDITVLTHSIEIIRCQIKHTQAADSRIGGDIYKIQHSAIYHSPTSGGFAFEFTGNKSNLACEFTNVSLMDAHGVGKFSGGSTLSSIVANFVISIGVSGASYNMCVPAGCAYTGDFNIFFRNQFSAIRNRYNNTEYTTLAGWQTATGQDSNSVTLSLAQYNAFWLGDPATGDFRINPSATCTWANGTVSQYFADGVTPLTAAGAQEHYDWATGQVVSGPPTCWPDAYIPLTRAQIAAHLSM